MKLPNTNSLNKIKNKTLTYIGKYKILILIVIIIVVALVYVVVWAIKIRNNFLSNLNSSQKDNSNGVYYVASNSSDLNPDILPTPGGGILGASDSISMVPIDYSPASIPTPFPTFVPPPLPSLLPVIVSNSTPNCAGTPTAFNSEAIVSASSTMINNAVNITVELLDCNNNYAPVNDSLTVTLSNNDSSAKINNSSSPVTIKSQNGKATFSVNSQNAISDTFIITDTDRSFNVTDPNNHNPSVTFTSNTTGNPNCTTGAGTANSWYSDVYPNSPVTINVGSTATFNVVIRDCFKNNASSNDSLSISLSSGDSSTKVSGNSFPYSLTTQSGQASFNITSQNPGTNVFIIQDKSSSFTITDTNNNNPSVVFSNPSAPTSTPAPTPAGPSSAPTQTPVPAPTTTPIPDPTSTPFPTPTI